jgi:hypothetical protein
MLRPLHLGLSIALLFCYPAAHADPTTNKCTDGKQITYANMPCEDLGLQSIGPVKKTIVVVPAVQKPKTSQSEDSGKERNENKDVPKDDAPASDVSGTGKTKPLNSLMEKLLQ